MPFRKTVVVVGAGWDQLPMILEARRQGHRVVALDGNPQAIGLAHADVAHVVSTRDEDAVLAVARAEGADALTYMITESPMRSIRHAADALGLPGPSHKSVEATQSKVRMREIFQAAGVPNARFGMATTISEAVAAAERIGFPLVIKSADVGGQLGIFRLETMEELNRHFGEARRYSVSGQVILEEWLEGPEVNVVAVVLAGRVRALTVSDRIKHPRMAFGIVQRHLYPAALSAEQHATTVALTQQTVEAMEIVNGIVFPQAIVTPRGPILAETGERIPGGVMKELFEYATGYDLVRLQLDIALGAVRDLESYRQHPGHAAVTVQFLNSRPGPLEPGRVAQVVGREQALALDGVVAAQFYNDPTIPQEIRALRHARDRFYFVIAVGTTRDEVVDRSNRAAAAIDFLDASGRSLKRAPGAGEDESMGAENVESADGESNGAEGAADFSRPS